MAYETQPGTVAHRALAHLRAHPGREFSTAELAEALDVDSTGFTTFLAPAKSAGMVSNRIIPGQGKVLWWRLGDGKRQPTPIDDEKELQPRQVIVPAATATPIVLTAPQSEPLPILKPAVDEREVSAAPPKTERKAKPRDEFDAWLSGRSGALVLTGVELDDDGHLLLEPKQVALLRELIARVPA